MNALATLSIIDSHTEGEPTRVVVGGGPVLSGATLSEQAAELERDHSGFLAGVVKEPRGSDAVVGALLCEPLDSSADVGVIFFNNVGCLGMCGHGTIGLVRTLQYMGRLEPGEVRIETPVGSIRAVLHDDQRVSVANVFSYRYRQGVEVEVDGVGTVTGDIAYGGNWFFLVNNHDQDLRPDHIDELTRYATRIRKTLGVNAITGAEGAEIDHIELFGPPSSTQADSRNFVLCPGLAYDRSPCGTGLSAKLACLAADGVWEPGQVWRQESIVGSMFEGTLQPAEGGVLPTISGRAFITAEATLVFEEDDPFREGVGP